MENRPGTGSMLGYEAGVKAAPDGYTLTLITPYAINPGYRRTRGSQPPSQSAMSFLRKSGSGCGLPVFLLTHTMTASPSATFSGLESTVQISE